MRKRKGVMSNCFLIKIQNAMLLHCNAILDHNSSCQVDFLRKAEDILRTPPVILPRTDGKIKKIEMSEDVYVQRFFKKHPYSLYHDAVKISGFDPPLARVFAWRVLRVERAGSL